MILIRKRNSWEIQPSLQPASCVYVRNSHWTKALLVFVFTWNFKLFCHHLKSCTQHSIVSNWYRLLICGDISNHGINCGSTQKMKRVLTGKYWPTFLAFSSNETNDLQLILCCQETQQCRGPTALKANYLRNSIFERRRSTRDKDQD